MTRKFLLISIAILLTAYVVGWETAMLNSQYNNLNHNTQAIPIIRFERVAEHRNALIIGLYNPGPLAMEIYRTELFHQADDNTPKVMLSSQQYTKPLVLDPGDTILVPLLKNHFAGRQAANVIYRSKLEFQIPGQPDRYCLVHEFSHDKAVFQTP